MNGPDSSPSAAAWLGTVSQQVVQTAVVLLVAVLIILASRLFIHRMLRAVAGAPGFVRLMALRGSTPAQRRRESQRRERRTTTIASLLTNAVTVVVVVVSLLTLLQVWEYPATPLLTSVGIVGVAVGFGFQQILRDYLAGIFITLEDQFGIGDLIETSEVVGRVRAMSLRITTVEAEDGAIWYLRNGEILRVANRSQGTATTAIPVTRPAEDPSAPSAPPTGRLPRTEAPEGAHRTTAHQDRTQEDPR